MASVGSGELKVCIKNLRFMGGRMEKSTAHENYTSRLINIENAWWRKILDPQIPYRWFLNKLGPGFMLDIGCGVGRNLLNNRGRGVGIDHNPTSIRVARSRGLTAFTAEEFRSSEFYNQCQFDSLLFSHVLEHMEYQRARGLVEEHLKFLSPKGRLIIICPQPAGFRSDKTHVEYFDLGLMERLATELKLKVELKASFPFPHFAGHIFKYNEWILVAEKQKNGI